VDYGIDTFERPSHGFVVADVPDLELDVAGEVVGTIAVCVNLAIEVVQRPNLVAVGE
jgi:hypothetical protein